MTFAIEFELEPDTRWIAEIDALPGVMVYGTTQQEAKSKVEALALRVLADCTETESTGHRRDLLRSSMSRLRGNFFE